MTAFKHSLIHRSAGRPIQFLAALVWSLALAGSAVLAQEQPPAATVTAPAAARPLAVVMPDDPAKWHLGTFRSGAAELARRGPEEQILRVTFQELGERIWDVGLVRPDLAFTEGATYRLRFQARSDEPRSVFVFVCQSQAPQDPIGLVEEVALTPKWQTFRFKFDATKTVGQAHLGFALATNTTAVEFARVDIQQVPPDLHRTWRLEYGVEFPAKLEFPEEHTDRMTLRMPKPSENPWDIRLESRPQPLVAGQPYAFLTQVRASAPYRGDLFLVAPEPGAPSLAPRQIFTADDQWQWRRLEFTVSQNDVQAAISLNVGKWQGDMEFAQPQLVAVPWRVQAARDAAAEIVPNADPNLAEVRVQQPGAGIHDLALVSRGWSIDAGQIGRVSMRAKAKSPRPVTLSLLARDGENQWQNPGCYLEVQLTDEWQSLRHDFVVQGAADLAQFYLQFGGSDVGFEVSDLNVEFVEPKGAGSSQSSLSPAVPNEAEVPEDRWQPLDPNTMPPDGWQVAAQPAAAAQAWRLRDEPERLRVRPTAEAQDSTSVMALRRLPTLRFREPYVLEYQARSDRPRMMRVSLAVDGAKQESLGLASSDRLTQEWRTYRHEFVAGDSTSTAQLALELGNQPTAVELGAVALRPQTWRLMQQTEATAHFDSSPDAMDAVSVAVRAAGRSAAAVQLVRDQLPFRKDARYRLTFRARAEQPRTIGCTVTQAQAHGRALGLGLHTTMALETDWRDFDREFVCPLEDENGGVYFWLGGADGQVQLADFRMAVVAEDVAPPTSDVPGDGSPMGESRGRWTLVNRPDCDAKLVHLPQRPELVRVEIAEPGTTRWAIHLYQSACPIRLHDRYVLNFLARADRPRTITLGVSQSYEPWDSLGLHRQLDLTDQWQAFRYDFVGSGTDDRAQLHFDLGVSNAAVELSDLSLAPTARAAVPYRPKASLKWFTVGGLAVWGGLMAWAWRRRQSAKRGSSGRRSRRRKHHTPAVAAE